LAKAFKAIAFNDLSVSIADLKADFLEVFEKSLEAMEKRLAVKYQPKEPTEYLTRKEVCEILKIDLSTLWRWTKAGVLSAIYVQNRTYYRRSQIDEVMKKAEKNPA